MKFIIPLFLICLLSSCNSDEKSKCAPPENYLVEISDLSCFMENENTILLDIRKPEQFAKGHIPNAQNIWRPDIRNPEIDTEGLMASKKQMEDLLGTLGATNESKIIIYDAKGNPDAARFWWIMRFYGHKHVYLLNGGLTKYENNNGEVTNITNDVKKTNYLFNSKQDSSIYASKELMKKAINDTNYIIIDTRCVAEFSGKERKGNAARAGRIPNSILINYDENIDYNNRMVFKSIKELEKVYQKVKPDMNIITYCQSGVRSAQSTFVLTELLGYKNVKNYDGSWLEWSEDTTLPILTDSTITL